MFFGPSAPCHSLTYAPAGVAALLRFAGASRFARASESVAVLRAAGLCCVVRVFCSGVSVFVGPTPAAVVASFPWLVSRG